MKDSTKVIVGIICLFIYGFACFMQGKGKAVVYIVGDTQTQATLVTAAHVPGEELLDYELMYEDIENDIAIYRNLKHELKKPSVNDEVIISDTIPAKVLAVDASGFTIQVSDFNEIVSGLSGVGIYSMDKEYLGFVSYLSGKSKIYCVSY